jgi:hypothetical protein
MARMSYEIKTHEVEIFRVYAYLSPQVMESMELEPEHTSRRYRAQFF